jgi:hypothetical protein
LTPDQIVQAFQLGYLQLLFKSKQSVKRTTRNMATNTALITLSGQEAEQLRKTIQDAHNHIQSAQKEIDRAQGCLSEVHSLLSLRSVNNTASSLTSPNSTIKAAPKAPNTKTQERKVQNKDGTQTLLTTNITSMVLKLKIRPTSQTTRRPQNHSNHVAKPDGAPTP